jgi:Peptidase family M48
MTRRLWPVGLSLLLAVGGCLPEDNNLTKVSSGFFDGAPQAAPPGHVLHAPASEEAAKRTLQVGGQVLAANPKLGVHPTFTTIGAPLEEIFHQDDKVVFLTEGLVNACRTDGQLAAVLSHELAKMSAEHQALVAPPPDYGPSMDVPVGKDYAGAFGPPDGTRAVELAVYERKHRKMVEAANTPADAEALTRVILEKAGGTTADLEAAAPVLRAAEEHMTFEKQMNGGK